MIPILSLPQANPIIMELLEESLSWDFDIFKLEEITDYHPLLYLGMEMFRRFDVFSTLNIDENVCKAWLAVIEAHYHKSNTYHNSTHAADVMQVRIAPPSMCHMLIYSCCYIIIIMYPIFGVVGNGRIHYTIGQQGHDNGSHG